MTEVSLEFIAQQLDRVLTEQRALREEPPLRNEVRQLREDMRFLREEVRLARGQIARIEDAITMDILDRLRTLETGGAR